MESRGRYYFVSDLHLGPETDPDGACEKAFVSFLKTLPENVKGLFLLGDIFDFWIDYRDVVPRGNVRTLAALAEIAERADVWFFGGNHDWWLSDYFEKELGIHVVKEAWKVFELDGLRVLAGHGDDVGKRSWKSRLMTWILHNGFCLALLKSLHPRWAFAWARSWSASSRRRHSPPPPFTGRDMPLYSFADEFGRSEHIDHYVFGHWHCSGHVEVESGGELHVLGAWSKGGEQVLVI